jgi:hypothetical protein
LPRVKLTLLIACAVLTASLGLAAPVLASHNETVYFEAPRDLLSSHTREATFKTIDSLGVRAIRIVLYWKQVAPYTTRSHRPTFDATNPSNYLWGNYDAVINEAHARGWSVLLTVSGPVPRWATAARRDNVTRPSAHEFGLFMTAVGRHYGSLVQTWSVWNEPNHPAFLDPQYVAGQPASPRIYRGLFQAAVAGLHTAGLTSAKVLMGETAPRGTGKDVAPLVFLRGALCLDSHYHRSSSCSALPADGYAHHAYTTLAGPTFVPPSRDDVTIGSLSRLTRAVDLAYRAHAVPHPMNIYLTEFGIQSKPNPFYGVSLAQQAEFEETSERIAWDNPRVAAFSQYLMRDDAQISSPASGVPGAGFVGFQSGLRLANGHDKPALSGFRLPLSASHSGGAVSLWGLVRPAHGVTTVDVLVIEPGSHRAHLLRRLTTDSLGHWALRTSYRNGRRWRVSWRSPAGTVYTGPPIRAY